MRGEIHAEVTLLKVLAAAAGLLIGCGCAHADNPALRLSATGMHKLSPIQRQLAAPCLEELGNQARAAGFVYQYADLLSPDQIIPPVIVVEPFFNFLRDVPGVLQFAATFSRPEQVAGFMDSDAYARIIARPARVAGAKPLDMGNKIVGIAYAGSSQIFSSDKPLTEPVDLVDRTSFNSVFSNADPPLPLVHLDGSLWHSDNYDSDTTPLYDWRRDLPTWSTETSGDTIDNEAAEASHLASKRKASERFFIEPVRLVRSILTPSERKFMSLAMMRVSTITFEATAQPASLLDSPAFVGLMKNVARACSLQAAKDDQTTWDELRQEGTVGALADIAAFRQLTRARLNGYDGPQRNEWLGLFDEIGKIAPTTQANTAAQQNAAATAGAQSPSTNVTSQDGGTLDGAAAATPSTAEPSNKTAAPTPAAPPSTEDAQSLEQACNTLKEKMLQGVPQHEAAQFYDDCEHASLDVCESVNEFILKRRLSPEKNVPVSEFNLYVGLDCADVVTACAKYSASVGFGTVPDPALVATCEKDADPIGSCKIENMMLDRAQAAIKVPPLDCAGVRLQQQLEEALQEENEARQSAERTPYSMSAEDVSKVQTAFMNCDSFDAHLPNGQLDKPTEDAIAEYVKEKDAPAFNKRLFDALAKCANPDGTAIYAALSLSNDGAYGIATNYRSGVDAFRRALGECQARSSTPDHCERNTRISKTYPTGSDPLVLAAMRCVGSNRSEVFIWRSIKKTTVNEGLFEAAREEGFQESQCRVLVDVVPSGVLQ